MSGVGDSFGPDAGARIGNETFVRTVELHGELASTNDRAIERAAEPDLELPLLVVAERQTAGRGRGDHRWWAAPGALTFSLLMRVDARLPAARSPAISLATGLAVGEFLAELAPSAEVRLKWPNDVFANGRKIGGILIEVPSVGAGRFVVGVGLNVNNAVAAAPAGVRNSAVSLCEIAAERFELIDVLVGLLTRIAAEVPRLADKSPRLSPRWRPLCMLQGRTVHLRQHREVSVGVCQGIEDDGALLLATPAGLRRFVSGTVEQVE